MRFAIPIPWESLQQLYNTADSVVVGNFPRQGSLLQSPLRVSIFLLVDWSGILLGPGGHSPLLWWPASQGGQ